MLRASGSVNKVRQENLNGRHSVSADITIIINRDELVTETGFSEKCQCLSITDRTEP